MAHHQRRGGTHGVGPPGQAVRLEENLLRTAHLAAKGVVGAEPTDHIAPDVIEEHTKAGEDFPLVGLLAALQQAADQFAHG
ncbi:hypothetical protein D3C81_1979890 [compost metagenome]